MPKLAQLNIIKFLIELTIPLYTMCYFTFLANIIRLVAWLMVLVLTLPNFASGQDNSEKDSHEVENHHRLSIMIAHTHIPKAVPSVTGSGALIVPSWGLNYEYWFNSNWAIGLHNDMEISTYIIEDENGSLLERTRPIIFSLVGIYKPWKGLELLTGIGRELEEHQNFWVYRFGVEYEIEIGHHWDIAPALVFDVKENLYDSWTLGLSVGRRF